MFRFLDGIFDRLVAALGALIFSQAPSFMQQYAQSLAGALSELKKQQVLLAELFKVPVEHLSQAIQMVKKTGALQGKEGEFFSHVVDRYKALSEASEALTGANLLTRPFQFLFHLQRDQFWSTADHFKLGLNLDIEGLVYALFGLVLGFLFYRGLRKLIGEMWSAVQPSKH